MEIEKFCMRNDGTSRASGAFTVENIIDSNASNDDSPVYNDRGAICLQRRAAAVEILII